MAKHLLVTLGEKRFNEGKKRKEPYHFLDDDASNQFLNDLKNTRTPFFLHV